MQYRDSIQKKGSKGFTLLELLVVIAIIGILSGVVLASLNKSRSKGSDAAVKSQLASIRPQAEIYYDANGNYGTQATTTGTISVGGVSCGTTGIFGDTTISNQIKGATADVGSGTVACGSSGAYWAIVSPLKSDPSESWCVDSTGLSALVTGTVTSSWSTGCTGTLN